MTSSHLAIAFTIVKADLYIDNDTSRCRKIIDLRHSLQFFKGHSEHGAKHRLFLLSMEGQSNA